MAIPTLEQIEESGVNMDTITEEVESQADTLLDQYGKTRTTMTGRENSSATQLSDNQSTFDTQLSDNQSTFDNQLSGNQSTFDTQLSDNQDAADNLIYVAGYQNVGVFGIGETVQNAQETLTYNGEEFNTTAGPFPYVTDGATPTADSADWGNKTLEAKKTVARSLNVLDSDVTYETPGEIVARYIYSASQQETYAVINDAIGSTIISVIGESLTTNTGTYPLYKPQITLGALVFKTLNNLIETFVTQDGALTRVSELADGEITVSTLSNNEYILNDSPGGGAKYKIMTAAAYGGTPDGSLLTGVYIGADHYIGGGVAYVAKYMPVKNEIDAEALGYYSGQDGGVEFAEATTAFNKVINYANGRPIKLGEKQNYYYNGTLGDQNNEKDRITILGTSMPSMSYNPNNPKEYTRLEGGTRIRGSMRLWCKSGRFFDFGVDGGAEATGWVYDYDGFKVITKSTALARDVQLHNVIALGRHWDSPAHAIIVSGHRRSTVSNCQGYSTWYGLSIDAFQSVVDGFIGGNNGRNVVNAKSHQATGSSGSKNNNNMTISNVNGLNPKTELDAYMGSSILAIEADSNALERVVVTGVTGSSCKALIAIVPFAGAVMKSITISNVTGADFDGVDSDYSAIFTNNGNSGGEIYTLNISNVHLSNLHYRAAKFEHVRFLNVDNFQADTPDGGGATLNSDFFHVTSTVLSASVDGLLLTFQDGLTGGTGQGAVLWDNTAVNNRKGPRMMCVNLGTGAPA